MATKLKCEICGGKLIGRPGGIFECDSCGTEYSTEWAKQKIQEIRGAVTVEGIVEVQGTVKVDSSPYKEALLQRGMIALEEEKWDRAREFFDQALNYDAKYADAYLGLAMEESHFRNQNELQNAYILNKPSGIRKNMNISLARKYMGNELSEWFRDLDAKTEESDATAKAKSDSIAAILSQDRNRIQKAQGRISEGCSHTVAIKSNGRLFYSDNLFPPGVDRHYYSDKHHFEVLDEWENIRHLYIIRGDDSAIRVRPDIIFGIQNSGKVLCTSDEFAEITAWDNIKDITCIDTGCGYIFVGLKNNGSITISDYSSSTYRFFTLNKEFFDNFGGITSISGGRASFAVLNDDGTVLYQNFDSVDRWENIVSVKCHGGRIDGLKADGTICSTDETINEGLASWKDIIAIEANWWTNSLSGTDLLIGIKKDGTVVVPNNRYNPQFDYFNDQISKWRNIDAVHIGQNRVFGITNLGQIVQCFNPYVLGSKETYNCDEISKWNLYDNSAYTYQRKATNGEVSNINYIIRDELINEKQALQAEVRNLTGLFSAKRRRDILQRISEIDSKLDGMK